tara:strand:+ start:1186 stop:1716 length:531 start_codon:yes stop_codon:yes gene_type:complete
MPVEMNGLAETLRDLGKIQPAMKRQVMKDIRGVVKPVVDIINARIPSAPPLSGMDHNGRTGWSNVKKVAVKVDARKPRRPVGETTQGATTMSVVRIVTKGAPVAIADMTGKAGGNKSRRDAKYKRPNFASALDRLGSPSRFMWKDIDRSISLIETQLRKTVNDAVYAANKELMKVR